MQKKRKKQILVGLVTIGLCVLVGGCLHSNKINGYTMGELKKKDAVMFKAARLNWGMVSGAEDYWAKDSYIVKYDGSVEVIVTYNLSGEVIDKTLDLSDKDYDTLIHFLDEKFKNNHYRPADACDGCAWEMKYYDSEGKLLEEYKGYTYGMEQLEKIEQMLEKYKPEN